jgi:hypothetical protein
VLASAVPASAKAARTVQRVTGLRM